MEFNILATTSPQGVTNLRIKTVSKQQITSTVSSTSATINTTTGTIPPTVTVTATATRLAITKPTEHTSIGGISIGSKNSG